MNRWFGSSVLWSWLATCPFAAAEPPLERATSNGSSSQQTAPVDLYGDPLPPGALARMGTTRFRQGDSITALAFSPDGAAVATGADAGSLRIWDTRTGELRSRLPQEATDIDFLAISPDGRMLAAGSPATGIGLREITAGRLVRRFGQGLGLLCVAFSPNGNVIATGGAEHTIRLWETATGNELGQLMGHEKEILTLQFSANGRLLASAGKDQTVRIWHPATMKEVHRCTGHEGEIRSLAFSPDGTILASGDARGCCAVSTIRLWEVRTGKEFRRFEFDSAGVCFLPDGKTLVGVSKTGTTQFWDTATGDETRSLRTPPVDVGQVAFDPDRKRLATGGGNTIRLWDLETGEELHADREAHHGPVFHVGLCAGGKIAVSGAKGEPLSLWETASGKRLDHLGYSAQTFALSADGGSLAVCEEQ